MILNDAKEIGDTIFDNRHTQLVHDLAYKRELFGTFSCPVHKNVKEGFDLFPLDYLALSSRFVGDFLPFVSQTLSRQPGGLISFDANRIPIADTQMSDKSGFLEILIRLEQKLQTQILRTLFGRKYLNAAQRFKCFLIILVDLFQEETWSIQQY